MTHPMVAVKYLRNTATVGIRVMSCLDPESTGVIIAVCAIMAPFLWPYGTSQSVPPAKGIRQYWTCCERPLQRSPVRSEGRKRRQRRHPTDCCQAVSCQLSSRQFKLCWP